jgi:hypothetical protein
MKSMARLFGSFACALVLASCGSGERSAPAFPTAPELARATAAIPSAGGVAMPVTSQGAQPAGFKAVLRVDPKPDEDGVIRGSSPLDVDIDACGSQAGEGGELTFLFDWDSDHVADVVGTGDACHQHHRYRVSAAGEVRTNACVVSGSPNAPGPSTYFSCRSFTFALVVPKSGAPLSGSLVGSYSVGAGPNWQTNPPTYSCVEACAVIFGGNSSQYHCSTTSSSIDGTANVSRWGLSDCAVVDEAFKINTTYNCGSANCSASAYVQDNCGAFDDPPVLNYCFAN